MLCINASQGTGCMYKNNQGNQDSSGNQKNVIHGQKPDIENRHTQQRT